MDAFQPTSYLVSARSPFGELAIVTCLVGGVAAFGSTGSAIPVGQVGFGAGWGGEASVNGNTPASPPETQPTASPLGSIARPSLPAAGDAALPIPTAAGIVPHEPSGSGDRVRSLANSPALVAAALPAPVAPEAPQTPPVAAQPLLPPINVAASELAVAPALVTGSGDTTDKLSSLASAPQPEAAPGSVEAQAQPAPASIRIIAVPELRDFRLTRLPLANRLPLQTLARPPAQSEPTRNSGTARASDKLVDDVVFHQVALSIGGFDATSVDVRIGPDMKPSIKVGDLLGLVADRMDPDSAARFSAATAAGEYVSFAALRTAGFDVSYNAGADSISISAVN